MNVVVTRKSRWGWWYVRLVALNGETVMHSQRYSSKGNAVRAARTLVEDSAMFWTLVVED